MKIVTPSSKGQFTIPKVYRRALGVQPGDRVRLTIKGGCLVLRRQGSIVQETAGSLAAHARRHRGKKVRRP